jgi:ribosomal protein S18 acetylase RimI-like enzyme
MSKFVALDNPVYHALTGPQAALSLRAGRVVRYPAAVAPFGALPPDPDDADWAALATLADPPVALIDPGEIPPAWTIARRLDVTQMVLRRPLDAAPAVEELGEADLDEMLELVEATHPGPFGPDTIRLGRYVGVRDGGRLVAMAGERMRPPGWTEVSAVCTAPTHRGLGLARRLITAVGFGIQARGEDVFLHVMSANTAAIGLYESMGFARSRTGSVVAVTPA